MPVIFAPRSRVAPSTLGVLSEALGAAYGQYRGQKERDRVLSLEEERRQAEMAERASRAEYRDAQMENMTYNRGRQERADINADLDLQAGEMLDKTIPQQQEIKRILEGLPPITMEDAGGLVNLDGSEIKGTGRPIELGTPNIKAPTVETLLGGKDQQVTLPGYGSIEERDVSVGDRAQALLKDRRAAQAAEIRKGGLKTFFDPNSNQYVSVYEGEARERGLLPEEAGKVFFDRQEENRKAARDARKGGGEAKAPKGMWRDDQYFEYVDGEWKTNEALTESVRKAKEDGEVGSPRESNEILTRYRDELGIDNPEDFAKQFEQEYPGDYEAAMSMVRGEIPPDKLTSMRSGRREYLVAMAQKLTGRNYNASQVRAMAKTRESFASGREAGNIDRVNTALDHIGVVDDTLNKLNQTALRGAAQAVVGGATLTGPLAEAGQFPLVNKATNFIAENLGMDKELVALDKALIGVATEVAAALKGGASPTEKEIDHQLRGISRESSPEAIRGFLETSARLLSGRIHALEDHWSRVFSGTPAEKYPEGLKSIHAKETLDRVGLGHVMSKDQAIYDPMFEAKRIASEREYYGTRIDNLFPDGADTSELPGGFELDE